MNYVITLYFRIRRYFFNFDTIMKKFAKAEHKMHKFQSEMEEEAMQLGMMIEALQSKRDDAITDADRAARVADRIAEFLS